MKNFISEGNSIQIAAPSGGVTGGSFIAVGSLAGVCVTDAAEGDQVTVMLEGSYSDLPKKTGEAWTQGEKIYWDAANSKLTTAADDGGSPATAFLFSGYAWADAASADTTGSLLLPL